MKYLKQIIMVIFVTTITTSCGIGEVPSDSSNDNTGSSQQTDTGSSTNDGDTASTPNDNGDNNPTTNNDNSSLSDNTNNSGDNNNTNPDSSVSDNSGSDNNGNNSGNSGNNNPPSGNNSGDSNNDGNNNSNTGNNTVLKAFPTAEGFGAMATGGRGGRVIKVTTLDANGPGSFQAALNQNEARIIIFDVSGIITGDINIPYGDVTIAGQTAPGAGITIHGRLTCDYDSRPNNIIIRHLRVRADSRLSPNVNGNAYDGVQCSRSSNLIFDHMDISGGVDENFDLYSATDVTVQWSTITRSNPDGHPEPEHNYGLINGPNGQRVSIHHNIFAHNKNRNPAIANGPAEIINNVIYNPRNGFVHHNPASGEFNIIGNYYKDGPDSSIIPFFFDDESNGSKSPALSYYLKDNYIDDPGDYVGSVDSPWVTPIIHSSFQYIDWGWDSSIAESTVIHTFDSIPISIHPSQENYETVLNNAGAFPRDKITIDNVSEIRNRSGSWGTRIPDNLLEGLTPTQPPQDTDNDGMPDEWESSNGLSITIDDSQTIMNSGYTAIEEYINSLAQ